METPKTLLEAIKFFAEPENCRRFMVAVRWEDGIVRCPNCGSDNVLYMEKSRLYFCRMKHAKAKFSLKVGTIFEASPVGLELWLPAVWLITNCKNGVSSYEIARALGVTQKTAWFMLHRIREAMEHTDGKLGGWSFVETDETFHGGKFKNMHNSKRPKNRGGVGGKAIIMGMLERNGRVRAQVIPERNTRHMGTVLEANVNKGSHIVSDEYTTYPSITKEYVHHVVNDPVEYVNGHIHTNSIENFWSLLKRGLNGTYISVEPFHLQAYVTEQVFRFNQRHRSDATRFKTALSQIVGHRLTYSQLTGKEPERAF